MDKQEQVIFSEHALKRSGLLGLITLNRPQVINALSTNMCQAIDDQLINWQQRHEIKFIVIRGEGERGFCAGGDIKQIYLNGIDQQAKSMEFFSHEYRMNRRIFHLSKPYITLLHGVSMGGGLGVSLHGSHVVAAENLKLAMPETGIGFYPDVGGTYFLSRARDNLGIYLGLTGNIINADSALSAGLIQYQVKLADLTNILTDLMHMDGGNEVNLQINAVLAQYALPKKASELEENASTIKQHFNFAHLKQIIISLNTQHDEFSRTTLATLKTKSPLSLQYTLAAIYAAKCLSFDQAMDKEYQLTQFFLNQPDFYEGVRAAIIDKDRKPHWTYPH